MKKLFSDFIIGLKTPNPDTVLVKLWNKKRARDKALQKIKAKQQTEEYRQKIKKEAYFLWEAEGKPEGKDDYYWQLAIDKIKGKNIPIIYKPYYVLEKRVLEPVDAWISRQAFFTILGRLGNLAVIAALVAFIFGEEVRRNNEVSLSSFKLHGEGSRGAGELLSRGARLMLSEQIVNYAN